MHALVVLHLLGASVFSFKKYYSFHEDTQIID